MADSPIWVLIPAYKPDGRMTELCDELISCGFRVLVVDDGSGSAYRAHFDAALSAGCRIERHAANLGKGRALKTGINAILNLDPSLSGIVTADADGQHTRSDIARVADAMREKPDSLVIGARTVASMPGKSRFGNTVTRVVYGFVTGIRCSDTQTGLRGLPARMLPEMLRLPGERYEYEMNMLLKLRDLGLSIAEVPIETIYIDDNKGSHFHPLRDSVRVYGVIVKFLLSSIVSFLVDYSLYLLLLHAFGLAAWICYALARVVSSLVNYSLNRSAVFGNRGGKRSFFRYYALAVVQLAVGALMVEGLGSLGFGAGWIKIPVDMLLFVVSYVLQRDFVFK